MNRLRDRSGTTLVEVMVSFTLLLLLMAVFSGALSFSRAASQKSAQIRAEAAEAAAALRASMRAGAAAEEVGRMTYTFKLEGGEQARFSIQVRQVRREVELEDGGSRVFCQFEPVDPPAGGGEAAP